MARWARVKQYGGAGNKLPQIASAATVYLPPQFSIFDITGSTGITALSTAMAVLPGRLVTLTSTDNTGAAITDTAASTASSANGTISLSGLGAITIKLGTNMQIMQMNNGQWLEVCRSVS